MLIIQINNVHNYSSVQLHMLQSEVWGSMTGGDRYLVHYMFVLRLFTTKKVVYFYHYKKFKAFSRTKVNLASSTG